MAVSKTFLTFVGSIAIDANYLISYRYELTKNYPPLSGILAALAVLLLTIVFASCSKDVIGDPSDVTITAQQGTDKTISYYAITDTEGIGFTSAGIEYQYLKDGKHKWLLGYQDIAQQLDLDIENFEKIRITRDRILSNGLWRFAISFDTQDQKDSYYIDVNPETGKIAWIISITDMPGGEFTLSISLHVGK